MADIYLTNTFLGFAARERISDATIVKVAREMQNQLYDASLGGCIYKKRIARTGAGKRGGYRVPIVFAMKNACFYARLCQKREKTSVRTSYKD